MSVVFPFVWVFRVATRSVTSYTSNPSSFGGGFTLSNFSTAWHAGSLGQAFVRTLETVPAGALLATLLASLAGFAFAKLDVPLRRVLLGGIVAMIAVPLPAIIIPLLQLGIKWHYVNSYFGLVLVFCAFGTPWSTFFFYSYFHSLPDVLIDCARVDGAGDISLFWRVALPLARPAFVTAFVINILVAWSNLLLALVLLPDPTKRLLILSVSTLAGQYTTGGPVEAAGLLIASAPIALLFVATQRFLRAGMLGGAVKG